MVMPPHPDQEVIHSSKDPASSQCKSSTKPQQHGRCGNLIMKVVIFYCASVCVLQFVKAINLGSPFSFSIYVVPVDFALEIGSQLGSLVALGALLVAQLALFGAVFGKGDEIGEHDDEWSRKKRHIRSSTTDSVLLKVLKRDVRGCMLRFVCELGTVRDKSQLRLEQELILNLFQSKLKGVNSKAARPFQKSLRLGQRNLHPDVCRKHYPLCPVGSSQMLTYYYERATHKNVPFFHKHINTI